MESLQKPFTTLLLLITICAATLYSYWFGIDGLFIFDDMPNLSPMGQYSGLNGWDNFKLFLLEGASGPTGRPISLASFYLNDNAWPSDPSSFTQTNILIHLINGLLVFWFSHKLAAVIRLTQSQQTSFSLLATAFWILHPLHTTTVLYIVQRMTELSALFMLTGMIFYLHGREILPKNKVKGFAVLFLGVGSSLVLSILSKENGILLVFYILVTEYFLLQPLHKRPPKHLNYWLLPAIILPALFVFIYLGQRVWHGGGFETRDFTFIERLLTEPRVIFDYLHQIFLPKIGSSGLFHDDYIVSESLFDPWTTLPAIIGLLVLLLSAIALRTKQPWVSFAITWFFAGHLLESTVVSLELYFEHRNYIPMLGFLIAGAWYGSNIISTHKLPVIAVSVSILMLFSFLVSQYATLWSKPLELSVNWYQAHPNSARAQEAYLTFMKPYGVTEKDFTTKQKEIRRNSPYSAIWDLEQACIAQNITPNKMADSLRTLKTNPIRASTSTALISFVSRWQTQACEDISLKQIEDYLQTLLTFETSLKNKQFTYNIYDSLAQVNLQKKDLAHTMLYLTKAYQIIPTVKNIKQRVAYLYSADLYQEALDVLNDTSALEKKGFRARWALAIKQDEINQLKKLITSKIDK